MQLGKLAIFLPLWLLCLSQAHVIGVSPEDQHLYSAKIDEDGNQYWTCLNDSSIKLQLSQINDDICDCPDGSDEPGTNACPDSAIKFYCANQGHFSAYIEQFKLNDGVCDYDICCDGSDEYQLGTCENKCDEIHRQFETYKAEQLQILNKALKKKQHVVDLSQRNRKSLINNLEHLERQVPEKKMKLNKLKIQMEDVELQEDTPDLYDILDEHFANLANRIEAYKRDILKQDEQLQKLEKILEELSKGYNPNYNDHAVKESIHKFQEYISNKEDGLQKDFHDITEFVKKIVENAKEHSINIELTGNGNINNDKNKSKSKSNSNHYDGVPSLKNMIHYYFNLFAQNFLIKTPETYVSKLSSNQLAPEIDKLEEELEKIEKTITVIKKDLSSDYGPDDILRAYEKLPISNNLGGYYYRVDFLNSIYQNDVLIGVFKEYKEGKLIFANGARCWNGPKRSATVEFICGEGPAIVSVAEPEKCHYNFVIRGEAWCHPVSEQELLQSFEIDYNLL